MSEEKQIIGVRLTITTFIPNDDNNKKAELYKWVHEAIDELEQSATMFGSQEGEIVVEEVYED